jgi:hypothetical protein
LADLPVYIQDLLIYLPVEVRREALSDRFECLNVIAEDHDFTGISQPFEKQAEVAEFAADVVAGVSGKLAQIPAKEWVRKGLVEATSVLCTVMQ